MFVLKSPHTKRLKNLCGLTPSEAESVLPHPRRTWNLSIATAYICYVDHSCRLQCLKAIGLLCHIAVM